MRRTTASGLILALVSTPAVAQEAEQYQAPAETLDAAVEAAEPLAEAGEREAAFRAALAAAGEADRAAVEGFYAGRAFAPFWTEAEGDRADTLRAALADAGTHGLVPGRYRPEELERLDGAPPEVAEIALTLAFLRYAEDMTGGLVEPSAVDPEINVRPERPEQATLLARLDAAPLGEVLADLVPARAEYAVLLEEKARLEAAIAGGGWGETVPDGPVIRLGDRDGRIGAMRARLAALGYPSEGPGDAFDGTLEAALKGFQHANGLVDDGVFGAETRATLNASPEDRINQILVNLERIRWLGDSLGERHVWVNIPDYTVSVFEGSERVYHTRSVVGERDETRTPEFSDRMTYFVVNPTWYIPDSIAERVYLPQLRQDPTVLARNNMRLFTRAGTEIDPGLVNFAALGDQFPFRVRQNPSASNALGRVKFMFPNQFAIYLHDTPARELFGRDGRAFSNGCIRLEQPFELAHYLLRDQVPDPVGAFQEWLDAGSERYVTLETPIDVHIVYRTAWADGEGVHFRRDVYGRDARLLAALAERGVEMPVRTTAAASLGQPG